MDLLAPRALLDQVVENEEKEQMVFLVHKENEAAEDYQDPPGAVGLPGKSTQHETSPNNGQQLGDI